eukprot:1787531-Pleurochrysis_carterae.AAC.2
MESNWFCYWPEEFPLLPAVSSRQDVVLALLRPNHSPRVCAEFARTAKIACTLACFALFAGWLYPSPRPDVSSAIFPHAVCAFGRACVRAHACTRVHTRVRVCVRARVAGRSARAVWAAVCGRACKSTRTMPPSPSCA